MTVEVSLGKKALDEGYSVALVKNGTILATGNGQGVVPLLQAINEAGDSARGCTVVDRVAGRAVALISLHFGVVRVHAGVLSQLGQIVLDQAGVPVTYDRLVPFILNRTGEDLCPIEKMVMDLTSPSLALQKIRTFVGLG